MPLLGEFFFPIKFKFKTHGFQTTSIIWGRQKLDDFPRLPSPRLVWFSAVSWGKLLFWVLEIWFCQEELPWELRVRLLCSVSWVWGQGCDTCVCPINSLNSLKIRAPQGLSMNEYSFWNLQAMIPIPGRNSSGISSSTDPKDGPQPLPGVFYLLKKNKVVFAFFICWHVHGRTKASGHELPTLSRRGAHLRSQPSNSSPPNFNPLSFKNILDKTVKITNFLNSHPLSTYPFNILCDKRERPPRRPWLWAKVRRLSWEQALVQLFVFRAELALFLFLKKIPPTFRAQLTYHTSQEASVCSSPHWTRSCLAGGTVVFFCFFFKATPHGLWDLSAPTRNWTRATAVKAPSPNHWTTRELPSPLF